MLRIAPFATTALLLAATPVFAASDAYLKIDTIEGEARTIEIDSWSWGASNSSGKKAFNQNSSRSNARLAEPVASDGTLNIVSPRDRATGQASGKRSHCPVGKHFPTAQLVLKQNTYSLNGVSIDSCGPEGVALTYQKIEMKAADAAPESGSTKATKTRSNIQNN